jgi:hypothetical protein
MAKIKTRETVKDVKAIDKVAVASQRMKDAFVRTKDQAENLMDDGQISPSEYAEDKIQYAAEDVSHEVGSSASSGAKKAVNKGKEVYRQHREVKKAERAASEPQPASRPAPPNRHIPGRREPRVSTPSVISIMPDRSEIRRLRPHGRQSAPSSRRRALRKKRRSRPRKAR